MSSVEASDVWIIAFDGGCSHCGSLASELTSLSEGILAARDLRDPEVQAWRTAALGSDAPWLPTLLRVRGETVKTWSGARLAPRLARLLGPARSWSVLKLLGDHQPLTGAASPERRRFLKTAAGTMLASGVLGGAAAAASAKDASQSGGSEPSPASTGTTAQQEKARAIVLRSEQWRRSDAALTSAGSNFRHGMTITQASENRYAAVYMTWLGRVHSMSATYLVDVVGGTVVHERTVDITSDRGSRVGLAVRDNGASNLEGFVDSKSREVLFRSPDGVPLYRGNVDPKTGTLVAAPGFGSVAIPPPNDGQVHADLFGINLCEFAVGALCSTGGGASCFGICVALGTVAGPAGLGCASICAFIAFLGCAGALEAICN